MDFIMINVTFCRSYLRFSGGHQEASWTVDTITFYSAFMRIHLMCIHRMISLSMHNPINTYRTLALLRSCIYRHCVILRGGKCRRWTCSLRQMIR